MEEYASRYHLYMQKHINVRSIKRLKQVSILTKEGRTDIDMQDKPKRWTEYIKELLNEDRSEFKENHRGNMIRSKVNMPSKVHEKQRLQDQTTYL